MAQVLLSAIAIGSRTPQSAVVLRNSKGNIANCPREGVLRGGGFLTPLALPLRLPFAFFLSCFFRESEVEPDIDHQRTSGLVLHHYFDGSVQFYNCKNST